MVAALRSTLSRWQTRPNSTRALYSEWRTWLPGAECAATTGRTSDPRASADLRTSVTFRSMITPPPFDHAQLRLLRSTLARVFRHGKRLSCAGILSSPPRGRGNDHALCNGDHRPSSAGMQPLHRAKRCPLCISTCSVVVPTPSLVCHEPNVLRFREW